ncbi:immunoglobulin-binding protein 1-like [Perognathus longimembris pacificus]|uniref:immunoglobulin-binding protein 1-like n=1 Tax=Perognathus longimembris pacificus TaxID=214514 RepID=UPI00201999F1|nr:immunoglobulin-binding protein 1-like [Perognathus longimembris pacificus]XP_048221576.1 immunoglobulin-binding protein 1-like [Perognathus longimembris pacificus]
MPCDGHLKTGLLDIRSSTCSLPSMAAGMAAAMAAETAAEGEAPPLRLPDLFESGRQILDEVEAATEPTGSRVIQDKVAWGLEALAKAEAMLAQLDLFSRNEDLEELASADLKYLLVPALRGALTLKQAGTGRRREHLQQAREHFRHFLTGCQHYGLADCQLPPAPAADDDAEPAAEPEDPALRSPPPVADLLAMASQRQAKVERYRRRKALEQRLCVLKEAVESGQAEDERVREYHLLQLRRWVSISLDELESIDLEMRVLRQKDAVGEASTSQAPTPERPPMKPFVLTRNKAQANVFGAGYPSLAAMTVSDWYEQRGKLGEFPDQGIAQTPLQFPRPPQRQESQEDKEEEDDEQALHRAREWDDWKDTHPRGYGNRQNMG